MFRRFLMLLVALVPLALAPAVHAQDATGTPEEAQAMVDRAIAFYKEVGRDAALAEFSNPKGKFIDRDLYVLISDFDGIFRAHGTNKGLINKNLIDLKDVNGVLIIREMIRAGRDNPAGGWVGYTWTNPVTKKLEPKKTFAKVYDNLIFMVGVYDKSRA